MKKNIITSLVAIALLFSLNLLNKADPKDLCRIMDCKEDGFCDPGDPSQGWACTPQGSGVECSMYYTCVVVVHPE